MSTDNKQHVAVLLAWNGKSWSPVEAYTGDRPEHVEAYCHGVDATGSYYHIAWVVTDDDASLKQHDADDELIREIRSFLKEHGIQP